MLHRDGLGTIALRRARGYFLEFLEIPPTGRSMFQAWLSSFAQSYYALFRIQQRLGLVSELGHESEVDWEAFVQRFGVSVASNDAWQILGSIFGLTPGQRAQAGLTFEGGTSGTIEELQDFMGLALRVRYGYAADSWASASEGLRSTPNRTNKTF